MRFLFFLFCFPMLFITATSGASSLSTKYVNVYSVSLSKAELKNEVGLKKRKGKIRAAKKDWIDKGGLGKLAMGCLALTAIFLLWFNPPVWLVLGTTIGAFVFAVTGWLAGGENVSNSRGVLGVFGVLGIFAGLTLWMLSKRKEQ